MRRQFTFVADTVDGKIQEFPQKYYLDCGRMSPQGTSIVRNFDGNECIQAMSVFLVYYDGHLFGSRCYKSMDDFVQARKARCFTDYLLLNGCGLELNDCGLILN